VGDSRDAQEEHAPATEPVAAAPAAAPAGLAALHRSAGNAAVGRLLRAAPDRVAALRRLDRWSIFGSSLAPDVAEPIERHFEPGPFVKTMNAEAERELDYPLPQKFAPGDHVWFCPSPAPGAQRLVPEQNLPRLYWFPKSQDPTDFNNQGDDIRYYVIYADKIFSGRPHMNGRPGTFAWLHNNPGNLTYDGRDHGQIPGKLGWHNFMIFPSYEKGKAAILTWLKANGYYAKGILDAWKGYAPEKDGNHPLEYATGLVTALAGTKTPDGATVTLDTLVGSLGDDQMVKLQAAIEDFEKVRKGTEHARSDPDLPPELRARL
jgi:hypothetical protein